VKTPHIGAIDMAKTKRILIVGGGYGGVWAGKILEKHFRRREDVEITLVDKHPFHTLMTELHEVAGWRAEPESVQVDFRKIFGEKRIRCVSDEIERIDLADGKAYARGGEYAYDYLVLGAGARPEYFGLPGVEENSMTLWSFEDAMRIRRHVEDCFLRAAAEPAPDARRRLLRFVVAGAGFTGVEMAGELLEYRDAMCRKLFIDPSEVRIEIMEALPSILPSLDEALRSKAAAYLAKRGCGLKLGCKISGAEPGRILFADAEPVEAGTFIWTCGVRGSEIHDRLGLSLVGRSRIATDAGMRAAGADRVYIVGDGAGLVTDGKPMPMIVESAHFSAKAAAANVIADIDGGPRAEFQAAYHGIMVCIGSRYGVSNAGGMRTRGFIAMAIKHAVNMLYLFQIAGFNQVWEYLKHEFLDNKGGRSIIGGFAAHKVRGYWPLLLRLWLGLSWVFEGINKIGEGWLSFASGSASAWMFSKGVVQAGAAADATGAATQAADAGTAAVSAATSAAVDAASAATQAAGAAAGSDAVSAATGVAQAAHAAVDAASAATQAAGAAAAEAAKTSGPIWDFTKPILDPSSPLVLWFKRIFMDGIFSHLAYQLFQAMVVGTEIAIGLALLGGLLTWPAAAASIGLCLVFTLSGMFSWNQLWFLFAAVLMMGGAGRAFGLDYWAVPFFKRWWNGTKPARRFHLYGGDPTK
jgi:NADH:ubiquinone reductase (H+-translocating)